MALVVRIVTDRAYRLAHAPGRFDALALGPIRHPRHADPAASHVHPPRPARTNQDGHTNLDTRTDGDTGSVLPCSEGR
jgi:hypothetical protein